MLCPIAASSAAQWLHDSSPCGAGEIGGYIYAINTLGWCSLQKGLPDSDRKTIREYGEYWFKELFALMGKESWWGDTPQRPETALDLLDLFVGREDVFPYDEELKICLPIFDDARQVYFHEGLHEYLGNDAKSLKYIRYSNALSLLKARLGVDNTSKKCSPACKRCEN